MGIFDNDEHTLFKPAPGAGGRPEPAGATGAHRAQPAMVAMHDEEDDRASLGELLSFAYNSSKRRKLLSFFVLMVGAGLTFAAVQLAPRTYESTGEVLVVSPAEEQTGWGNQNNRQQLEWERQVRSREAIDGVIRDVGLVDKWDDQRQPLRRLLDDLSAQMGDRAPTPEQKFGALVGMLENRLKLNIDQSTVTIQCEWQDPEASRDIVQAALSHFIDKRYQTEVGTILTRIKPLEDQLESARQVLEKIDPSIAPAKEAPTEATPAKELIISHNEPTAEAQEATRKLPAARERQAAAAQRFAEIDGNRQQRITMLQGQLQERSASLGPAHPEIMALKLQIESAKKETPEIVSARAAKERADADVADLARIAGVSVPKPVRVGGGGGGGAEKVKKLDELTLAKIGAARAEYDRKKAQLDDENLRLRVAEAAFKSKYQVTRPPDVPFTPKKPVGLMVGLGGALATILLMLALASLRDRSAGILFEAKHVRDKLRLPVLGDMRESDLLG